MKELFNRIYDQSTNLKEFDRKQIQLYFSHCWSTPEDGLLQTGQDYH